MEIRRGADDEANEDSALNWNRDYRPVAFFRTSISLGVTS